MKHKSTIIEGQRKDFVEKDCTIEFEGKEFSSGGAWIMMRKDTGRREGLLYLYQNKTFNKEGVHIGTDFHVGTWDGSKKVHAVRLKTWRSNFGDKRSHFYFIWEGIKFWGINAGDNDIVRCHEYKNQK